MYDHGWTFQPSDQSSITDKDMVAKKFPRGWSLTAKQRPCDDQSTSGTWSSSVSALSSAHLSPGHLSRLCGSPTLSGSLP